MSSTYWLESKLPLMLVLGLIDFMTAVVMMPMNVLGYALEKWPFEPWTCRVQAYFYLK